MKMLVLTRHPTERILIGDDITIKVIRISDNQVSIGIDAPKSTLILREEVFLKNMRNKDPIAYSFITDEQRRDCSLKEMGVSLGEAHDNYHGDSPEDEYDEDCGSI
jgi:carbon storage regulator